MQILWVFSEDYPKRAHCLGIYSIYMYNIWAINLKNVKNRRLTYHSNLFESRSPNQQMNCGESRDEVERLDYSKKYFAWIITDVAVVSIITCTCLLQNASLSSICEVSVRLPGWCLREEKHRVEGEFPGVGACSGSCYGQTVWHKPILEFVVLED